MSRSEEGQNYSFTISNLPLFEKGDPRQYSTWINLQHNSSDPDSSYRGMEHGQRVFPGYFWSGPTIFAFHEAIGFSRKNSRGEKIRINPFPIPRNKSMINFIDKLRLQCLIFDDLNKNLGLEVLNKTEMDSLIGARTKIRGYENCWTHWGRKDFGFLYTPE
jgi:hypothetical protein